MASLLTNAVPRAVVLLVLGCGTSGGSDHHAAAGSAGAAQPSAGGIAGTGGSASGAGGSTTAGSAALGGAGTGGSSASGMAGMSTGATGGMSGTGGAGTTTGGKAGTSAVGGAGTAGSGTGGLAGTGGDGGDSGDPLSGMPVEEGIALLPADRQEHGVVAAHGEVYVLGGYSPDVTPSVIAYDPAKDSWRSVKDFPSPFNHPAAGVIDDKIYVAGFYAGTSLTGPATGRTFVYDPVADTWTEKKALPDGTERAGG
ncbi:MAG TPA: hypothetical protein VNN72_03525 [Polyangiaceae bacterium]|nr:hypothetical protein [Polyangiaceae bacterium]